MKTSFLWILVSSIFLVFLDCYAQNNETSKIPVKVYGSLVEANNCIPEEIYSNYEADLKDRVINNSSLSKTNFPLMRWPLGNEIYDGNYLQNYVDQDPAQGVFKDYQCGSIYGYSGHNVTDINLYNFYLMDKGIPVVAAAAGTVSWTIFDMYDRNTGTNIIGTGNGLRILHDDGSRAIYFHLRKNSVTVEPGERVSAGQLLGYVASSGFSSFAHLHIEFWETINGNSVVRDPWNGVCNPFPSLWENQLPYVGNLPSRFLDMGVSTRPASGGRINNISLDLLKERLTQPTVVGIDENQLVVWIQLQEVAGENYTLEILKPDQSIFERKNYTNPFSAKINWHIWPIDFSGNVTSDDTGNWIARIKFKNEVVNEVAFEVGENTLYYPRLKIAGKSLRVNGEVQKDTMHVTHLANYPIDFKLINAPEFVSINDSIITLEANSDQPNRSLYFQVLVTDNIGLTDTMRYHIVDPAKPLDQITKIENEQQLVNNFLLNQNYPNPFNPSTVISYTISSVDDANFASPTLLKVYDVLGNEIATLVNEQQPAGSYNVVFNADNLSSGIYFYQLQAGNNILIKKMILLK